MRLGENWKDRQNIKWWIRVCVEATGTTSYPSQVSDVQKEQLPVKEKLEKYVKTLQSPVGINTPQCKK